ncbi:uncharacterized protein TRAVEDRAFT_35836 [Trametes versicolor FP-101664 SS1]|uniref:uncharacterized protein n=1 Tax=Trametes versicolor (strain FP-101664) TaxID=717944 RepID=UPI0004623B52|nr:uncharacterized protein TRAVEDRAFT_35836 [Trametes versicolor FP-101664 SS1]EIW60107.1 hypothetical protein TRAVEDRAFT_35836 [Trametes versicolor FP-101664 SS1]
MKSALVFLGLVGCALAQSVAIFAPAADASVTAGSDLLVDVEKKPGLSGTTSVSVVIGLTPCRGDCSAITTTGGIGQVLFKGNYDPQIVAGSGSSAGFQNFTVTIPSATPKGPALLNIGHYFLGGAALVPGAESVNTTINIQ